MHTGAELCAPPHAQPTRLHQIRLLSNKALPNQHCIYQDFCTAVTGVRWPPMMVSCCVTNSCCCQCFRASGTGQTTLSSKTSTAATDAPHIASCCPAPSATDATAHSRLPFQPANQASPADSTSWLLSQQTRVVHNVLLDSVKGVTTRTSHALSIMQHMMCAKQCST